MDVKKGKYIPVFHFNILTPVYDLIFKWGMREGSFKLLLVAQAQIHSGERVLDLGCGTGTLTIMLKQASPEAEIIGVDGDPRIITIAREKAVKAGMDITSDEAMPYDLPYPNRSFDSVVSSLVIHHLSGSDKLKAFQEVRRVLKNDGEFHMVDFGRPHTAAGWLLSQSVRHLEQTKGISMVSCPAGCTRQASLAWLKWHG